MTDYTPTVEQARAAYTRAMRNAFIASSGEHDAEFDRMIAVVEAQALEQAVEFLATTPAVTIAGKGGAAELLRARAVEIREGRQ